MLYLKKIDGLVGTLLARLLPRPVLTEDLSSPVSSFLLIRPGGIGDALLLIPLILSLRKVYPECRIDVLAEKRNGGVFALCPEINEVLCYDKVREISVALRRRYDVVIDSEQWHRLSVVVARIIRSRIKIGFETNERKRLLTHPVIYRHETYELNSFLDLLRPLKIEPAADICSSFLTIPDIAQKRADKLLEGVSGEPFVALFPGASIAERCWGVEKFRQLVDLFVKKGISVVVVGGKEDAAAGQAIVAGTSGLNLAGKTSLPVTAGVLSRSHLLVSGDSGVLHIGVGLGIPTVSLFGPGIASKWAPRGDQHIVINHRLPCSPCTRFGTTPSCAIGAKCMQDISATEVFDATQKLW